MTSPDLAIVVAVIAALDPTSTAGLVDAGRILARLPRDHPAR